MFERIFAESGLSLDRLRALVEVGAAGSIVKAAGADPARQSQYSRQIKELEDFFRTRLIERHGKGIRLTTSGKELARISRFFMMGLSNFQRGSLAERQTFRIGAGATFIRQFLLPVISAPHGSKEPCDYVIEVALNEEIERRLHDLTLDFGVVSQESLSRPLQTRALREWKLALWVPRRLGLSQKASAKAFAEKQLPLAICREANGWNPQILRNHQPSLVCDSYLDCQLLLEAQELAVLLPELLMPAARARSFVRIPLPDGNSQVLRFYLAWNPRLLRLNAHATRQRDWLLRNLAARDSSPCSARSGASYTRAMTLFAQL